MTAITLEQILECPGATWAAIELYHGATGLSTITVDGLLQAVSTSLAGSYPKRQAMAATVLAWDWLCQLGLVGVGNQSWLGRHVWGRGRADGRIAAYRLSNGDPEQFVRLASRWPTLEEVS